MPAACCPQCDAPDASGTTPLHLSALLKDPQGAIALHLAAGRAHLWFRVRTLDGASPADFAAAVGNERLNGRMAELQRAEASCAGACSHFLLLTDASWALLLEGS